MTFEEKTLKSEKIYKGAIINLRRDKVTVQGGTSYREIIEHNGGAVIAALTEDKKLVMVRQYRKPAEKVMLEVPAGKIDPGEKPLEAAVRELKEETGLDLVSIEDKLFDSYSAIGFSNETNAVIIGKAAGTFKPSTSTYEEITAAWYSRQEVKELLKNKHFAARTQAFCYMWAKMNDR